MCGIGAGRFALLHELDQRHRRSVALTLADLIDAGVPAALVLEAPGDDLEQLAGCRFAADARPDEPPVVLGVFARDAHQLFDLRANILRLRLRGRDALVEDEGRGEAPEERLALVLVAAELAACLAMSHFNLPLWPRSALI